MDISATSLVDTKGWAGHHCGVYRPHVALFGGSIGLMGANVTFLTRGHIRICILNFQGKGGVPTSPGLKQCTVSSFLDALAGTCKRKCAAIYKHISLPSDYILSIHSSARQKITAKMGFLIHRELSSFNLSIDFFMSSRLDHDCFEFTAISISGETASVYRKAHSHIRTEKSPESDNDPTTIFEAIVCGVKRQTGLSVSHVLEFVGLNSNNRVLTLYFLVTLGESSPSGEMSPRDDISEDAIEAEGVMWIEKERVQRHFDDGSWTAERTIGILLALKASFNVYEGNASHEPPEKLFIPAQNKQSRSLHSRYLDYKLFNRETEGLDDWQAVDRCLIGETNEWPADVLQMADSFSPEFQLSCLSPMQERQVKQLLTDIGDEIPTMEWTCVHAWEMNCFRMVLRITLFGRPWPTEKQKYPRSAMGEIVPIPDDTEILQ